MAPARRWEPFLFFSEITIPPGLNPGVSFPLKTGTKPRDRAAHMHHPARQPVFLPQNDRQHTLGLEARPVQETQM